MDRTKAADQIRKFIVEKFPLAKRKNLTNTDALLDSGILDSLGVLDLVGFIEKEFTVRVSDDELIPENFQTVDALVIFVESKSSNGSGSHA